MKRNSTLIIFLIPLIIFSLILGFFLLVYQNGIKEVKAGSDENVSGWAWSEHIGWISFNCNNPELPEPRCTKNYGVNIAPDGIFSGYAWSENMGWIAFADYNGDGVIDSNDNICPSGTCEAKMNTDTGDVSGWAKVLSWEDGWIKLKGTATDGSSYGVSVNTTTGEFSGWAWGDTVTGWISFNCQNCEGTACDSYPTCGDPTHPDYKVETSFSFNQPPNPPSNPTSTLNSCAWGAIPQVAPGLSVILNWSYSDPENDPQIAYEIWLDNDPSFSGNKFNHLVEPSGASSYALDLSQDDEGDWLSSLNFNTTYYWAVRVKDSGSQQWSDFSLTDSFLTPSHAYPNPDFNWSPSSPSLEEFVQFCSIQESGVCSQDLSTCYSDGEAIPSPSCTTTDFSWTFPGGTEFATGSSATVPNPEVRFTTTGDKSVSLKITDDVGFCTKTKSIKVTLPLPKWKEVKP